MGKTVIQHTLKKYCPKCGKCGAYYLGYNLSERKDNILTIEVIQDNKFLCKHCNSEFETQEHCCYKKQLMDEIIVLVMLLLVVLFVIAFCIVFIV